MHARHFLMWDFRKNSIFAELPCLTILFRSRWLKKKIHKKMKNIINNEPRELMTYVPVSMKVLTIETQKSILGISDENYSTEFGDGGDI